MRLNVSGEEALIQFGEFKKRPVKLPRLYVAYVAYFDSKVSAKEEAEEVAKEYNLEIRDRGHFLDLYYRGAKKRLVGQVYEYKKGRFKLNINPVFFDSISDLNWE